MPSSISSSDGGHGRAGRRALWRFATIVAVLLALFAGASEVLLRRHVVPQDSFADHVSLFRATVLTDAAFGDSHVARDFVPDVAMANLAYPSENIDQMDWKARAFFAGRAPGRIVLQADPHLFAPYRLTGRPEGYSEKFDGTAGPPLGLYILDPRFRPQITAYWSAYLRAGGDLASKIVRTANGALLSPGDLSAKAPRARLFEARERILWHSQRDGDAVVASMRTYSALLDFLSARGAQLCMVSFPLSPDYRTAFAERADPLARRARASTLAYFAAEAERVGAVYVDHRAAIDELAHFRDVDHLNRAGAQAYSGRLLSDCFGKDDTGPADRIALSAGPDLSR